MPPFKKKPVLKKKTTKTQTLARPKLVAVSQERGAIPSLVLAGLREDMEGTESVFVSDYSKNDPITGWVSTGSFLLDCAIGLPNGMGFPYPAIVEIVGKESSAKSSVAYAVMGNMQREGGWAMLEDAEGTFTPDYARLAHLDLSPERFGYSQMARLEECLKAMGRTVDRNFALAADLPLAICLDSVAGTTVEEEQETDGNVPRALHARILARSLRQHLVPSLYTRFTDKKTGEELLIGRPLIIMFINQLKATMAATAYQQQLDSFGGVGLKYHARVRIQIDRAGEIKEDSDAQPVGIRCRARVLKNKVAPPYRTVEFDFRFASGIEDYIPTMEVLAKYGGIEKAGKQYVWKGKKYFTNAFRDFLANNPDEWDELKVLGREVLKQVWQDRHYTPPVEEVEEDLELA